MLLNHPATVGKLKTDIMLYGVDNFFLAGVNFIINEFDFRTSTDDIKFSVHYFYDTTLVDLLISLKKIKTSDRNVIFCGETTRYLLRTLNLKTNALILSQYISIVEFKEKLISWLCGCNHKTGYLSDLKYNHSLTPIEWKVINFFCYGFQTKDIAFLENIKTKTVSSHKRNAMKKIFAVTNQELYAKFMLLAVLNESS
ncbi:LuxR C-terminal-related transcriptional regulator [Cedecea davisae]|uniref:LuxR C-terminal-related transcriptional regulator n=1 Tax=Cedecea davisae TaxID=158484 RepID=UPI00242C9D67|nr:LuxR C-terminal-related transcriptional regulator [Cedecea davisae]